MSPVFPLNKKQPKAPRISGGFSCRFAEEGEEAEQQDSALRELLAQPI